MTRTQKWTAGAVALSALLLAAGWLLLIGPRHAEAAALREQTVAQEQENLQLTAQLSELKKLAADLPAKQEELAALRKQIPDTVARPALVRKLSALGKDAGTEVV